MPPSTKEARLRQRTNWRERNLGKTCDPKKLNFTSYYVALKTCERLRQVGDRRGQAHGNPLYVYHCDACGGTHIGHLAADESILMYGAESVNIREAQNIHA